MDSVTQDSAEVIEKWYCNNDMRINTSKTKDMVICFRKDRTFVDVLPYIYINGNNTESLSNKGSLCNYII